MKNILIKVTVKLPESLLNQLDDFQRGRNFPNRSEACRYVIEAYLKQNDQQIDIKELKDRHEFLAGEIGSLINKNDMNNELYRYIASLLTSLVRKSSRSDPGDAEKMILKARAEATQKNE